MAPYHRLICSKKKKKLCSVHYYAMVPSQVKDVCMYYIVIDH